MQFQTDEVSTDAASLTIRAEAADNAATYQATTKQRHLPRPPPRSAPRGPRRPGTPSARRRPRSGPRTSAPSSSRSSARSGWAQGNALALQFSGTGRRTAEAFESGAATAPRLHVEFTTGPGGPVNQAPTVSAGPDRSVVQPGSATLDGTVTDDGLPTPPGAVTTTWSRVSGPGTVTFANASAVDTTATFSQAGTYVLRLTAYDGSLTTADEVTVTVTDPAAPNQPPGVDAGIDQSVVRPAAATLDGTVTDDGLPNPPGAVTTTWTKTSGPGTVTFGNPAAVDTTATFSQAGTYVLRLTANDGALTASDEVTVTVTDQTSACPTAGTTQAVDVRIAAGSDDAEQRVSGATDLASNDLELVTDGSTQQVVGLRFTQLLVPTGSTITNAYVQFQTDEVSTDAASLTIRAEASDNAATYQATTNNVTSRATTPVSASWTPPAWNTVGEASAAQRTPNLCALVQAVVNRSGWAQGNALALQFSGTGRRTAEAFESGAATAPRLHVEYTPGPGGPVNQAPLVSAGPDQAVDLPGVGGPGRHRDRRRPAEPTRRGDHHLEQGQRTGHRHLRQRLRGRHHRDVLRGRDLRPPADRQRRRADRLRRADRDRPDLDLRHHRHHPGRRRPGRRRLRRRRATGPAEPRTWPATTWSWSPTAPPSRSSGSASPSCPSRPAPPSPTPTSSSRPTR